ncbi:MAG TPA: adenylate/guanylate cyclase domain-containing protein [Burkholderiales bacterium]|nr:adenylate/guanylate cyclase domain-containing protein [Burkholderiales bacterium]
MTREKACLAVLFADVSDSTRLYEKMGDTGAFGQIRECLQLLTDSAQQAGGWVVKTIGDGVMCAFENPDAAARAAMEMQKGLAQRPAARGKAKLTIRIGFHYGNVLRENRDVYGDTVNTASRVAGLAAAGQILMTEAARAGLSAALQSQVRSLEALPVKGKVEAVDVRELQWQDVGTATLMPGRSINAMLDLAEPRLRLVHAGGETVFRSSVTIGREPDNDIVIASKVASRNHAYIDKRKDKFVLIDRSSNGTFVTVSGDKEIVLRREEFTLYGSGSIAFGESQRAHPDTPTILFHLESAQGPSR